MKEELVKFETAKLAKEKGFVEETKEGYFETVEHTLEMGRGGDFTFSYHAPRILSSNSSDKYTTLIALAPTQNLLQSWLRKTHNIFVEVRVDQTSSPKFYYFIAQFIGNPENLSSKEWDWVKISNSDLFRSYEDIFEEGLQEGLKLIIT